MKNKIIELRTELEEEVIELNDTMEEQGCDLTEESYDEITLEIELLESFKLRLNKILGE